MSFLNNFLKILLSTLIIITLFLTSCTKKRDIQVSNEISDFIYKIDEFKFDDSIAGNYFLITGDLINKSNDSIDIKAIDESSKLNIKKIKTPKRIEFLFHNLQIIGTPNTKYRIAFSIDKQFITAYKLSDNVTTLTTLEKQLARTPVFIKKITELKSNFENRNLSDYRKSIDNEEKEKLLILTSKKKGTLLVPIFKYKIEQYGILKESEDEFGQKTGIQNLVPSDWTNATHLILIPESEKRIENSTSSESNDPINKVYEKEKLSNLFTTSGILSKELQIDLNLPGNKRIFTRILNNKLYIYQFEDRLKFSKIDLSTQSYNNNEHLIKCNNEQSELMKDEYKQGCVLINKMIIPATPVKFDINIDYKSGIEANLLNINQMSENQSSEFILIESNQLVNSINNTDTLTNDNLIPIEQIKNKEFFFRRTIEYLSKSIKQIEVGTPSDIKIVRFKFEENKIVVHKVDSSVSYNKIDSSEIIMLLPVKYYKYPTSSLSNTTKKSNQALVQTNINDAEFVSIDWNTNQLPRTNSPIDEAGLDKCYSNITENTTSDLDSRLTQGILNFSYNYFLVVSKECTNQLDSKNNLYSRNNYDSSTTINIKERISFLINNNETDASYVPQVPFKIKSALGYGNWTNVDIDNPQISKNLTYENKSFYSNVSDFRNKKTKIYKILGLSELELDRRLLITSALNTIFSDWNSTFKKIFKGTEFEFDDDYFKFEIVENNDNQIHIGDLNQNVIYFNNKLSQDNTIGYSKTGINPRSGINISDIIIINQLTLESLIKKKITITEISNTHKKNILSKDYPHRTIDYNKINKTREFITESNIKYNNLIRLENLIINNQLTEKSTPNTLSTNSNLFNDYEKSNYLENNVAKINQKFKHNFKWVEIIFKILEENNGNLNSQNKLLFLENYLEEKKGELTETLKLELEEVVNGLKLETSFNLRNKKSNLCKMSARGGFYKNTVASSNFDIIFKNELMYTLSHEFGHSQGLTHNFMGSFDIKNMDIKSENAKNYSSIMDYFPLFYINYQGLGNQDIYALRAIYTGLIETNSKTKNYLKNHATLRKYLKFENYIQITELINLINEINNKPILIKQNNISNWDSINLENISFLSNSYLFCSDTEALLNIKIGCAANDYGTTFTELLFNNLEELKLLIDTEFININQSEFTEYEALNLLVDAMTNIYKNRATIAKLMNLSNGQQKFEHFETYQTAIRVLFEIITTPVMNQSKPIRINKKNQLTREEYEFINLLNVPIQQDAKGILILNNKMYFQKNELKSGDLNIIHRSDYDEYNYKNQSGDSKLSKIGVLPLKHFALYCLLSKYKNKQRSTALNYLFSKDFIIQNESIPFFITNLLQNKSNIYFYDENYNYHKIENITNPQSVDLRKMISYLSLTQMNYKIDIDSNLMDQMRITTSKANTYTLNSNNLNSISNKSKNDSSFSIYSPYIMNSISNKLIFDSNLKILLKSRNMNLATQIYSTQILRILLLKYGFPSENLHTTQFQSESFSPEILNLIKLKLPPKNSDPKLINDLIIHASHLYSQHLLENIFLSVEKNSQNEFQLNLLKNNFITNAILKYIFSIDFILNCHLNDNLNSECTNNFYINSVLRSNYNNNIFFENLYNTSISISATRIDNKYLVLKSKENEEFVKLAENANSEADIINLVNTYNLNKVKARINYLIKQIDDKQTSNIIRQNKKTELMNYIDLILIDFLSVDEGNTSNDEDLQLIHYIALISNELEKNEL